MDAIRRMILTLKDEIGELEKLKESFATSTPKFIFYGDVKGSIISPGVVHGTLGTYNNVDQINRKIKEKQEAIVALESSLE